MTVDEAIEIGYKPSRILQSGELAGVMDMLFTVDLFVDISRYGYRTRFCYPDRASAEAALAVWDGAGDPPGPWIREKPSGRMNPRKP